MRREKVAGPDLSYSSLMLRPAISSYSCAASWTSFSSNLDQQSSKQRTFILWGCT